MSKTLKQGGVAFSPKVNIDSIVDNDGNPVDWTNVIPNSENFLINGLVSSASLMKPYMALAPTKVEITYSVPFITNVDKVIVY